MEDSRREQSRPNTANADDVISAFAFAGEHALPTMLTVAEAAAFLRLDPRTVRDMFRAGELEGNQHGHCIRVMRESVIEWARGKRRVLRSKRRT